MCVCVVGRVCDYCPALRLCIGSGGGVAVTFLTQGWATVTEESWVGGGGVEGGGGGGGGCASPSPSPSLSMQCCRARLQARGELTLAIYTPVLRDGGTDACPQCQGLACVLSLTAPPTASSYITPSPSPGPLPAFIGLFLSFSTFAFSPHWLLPLLPPSPANARL